MTIRFGELVTSLEPEEVDRLIDKLAERMDSGRREAFVLLGRRPGKTRLAAAIMKRRIEKMSLRYATPRGSTRTIAREGIVDGGAKRRVVAPVIATAETTQVIVELNAEDAKLIGETGLVFIEVPVVAGDRPIPLDVRGAKVEHVVSEAEQEEAAEELAHELDEETPAIAREEALDAEFPEGVPEE